MSFHLNSARLSRWLATMRKFMDDRPVTVSCNSPAIWLGWPPWIGSMMIPQFRGVWHDRYCPVLITISCDLFHNQIGGQFSQMSSGHVQDQWEWLRIQQMEVRKRTIFWAIFYGHIPWNFGLKNRPKIYGIGTSGLGSWNGHWPADTWCWDR